MWWFPAILALIGCDPGEPPPVEPEPKPCDLTLDALDGRTFVRETRTADAKGYEPDPWARARFHKEGDALKLKYNTRALAEMYTYTCTRERSEVTCLSDGPDLEQWCKTLIANKGSCSPAALADVTGASVADAKKAHEALTARLAKLKPDELEEIKAAFSQPNNQLRGVFRVKIDKASCGLTVRDTYQTMTMGDLREVENYVGNAKFVPTDQELVFEDCRDMRSLVALAPDAAAPKAGESQLRWSEGAAIRFGSAHETHSKPKAGCTYTMDTWAAFEPVGKGVAVGPGADGKLAWGFTHTFAGKDRQVVHLVRYAACDGGEPKVQDVSCQQVILGEEAAASE